MTSSEGSLQLGCAKAISVAIIESAVRVMVGHLVHWHTDNSIPTVHPSIILSQKIGNSHHLPFKHKLTFSFSVSTTIGFWPAK